MSSMGLFGGGGKEKKKAKAIMAANQAQLAGLNLSSDALFKSQQKAEQARTQLSGSLGTPGSYEDSYEAFVTKNQGLFDYTPQGAIPKLDYLDKTAGELTKLSNLVPYDSASKWKDNPAALKEWLAGKGLAGKFSEDAITKFTQEPTASGAIMQSKAAFKQGAYSQIANMPLPDIIDPQKYTQYQLSTRQGRDVSYLTAQASQLARGEGPLWDSIQQSVVGSIKDGSAQLMRQSADELQRWASQGGTARRIAVEEVAQMQVQERINRDSIQQLRESNLNLIQWGQDNLRTNLSFTQAWVENLGGVRDSFQAAQAQMVSYYQATVLPLARQYAIQNYQLSLVRNSKPWMKVLGSVLKVVGTVVAVALSWTGWGLAAGALIAGAGGMLESRGSGKGWGESIGSGLVTAGITAVGAYAGGAMGGAAAATPAGTGVVGTTIGSGASTGIGMAGNLSASGAASSSGGLFSNLTSKIGGFFGGATAARENQ